MALPVEIAVTSPLANTVAIPAFDELHVTTASGMAAPPASFTVATSVVVSLIDENERLVGDSVIEVAVWVTETLAVALSEPNVAVMVAVPFATAVTRPDDETVATDVVDVVHVTTASDTLVPPTSFTVAMSVVVSLINENERLVGDNVIEVAV